MIMTWVTIEAGELTRKYFRIRNIFQLGTVGVRGYVCGKCLRSRDLNETKLWSRTKGVLPNASKV